VKVNNAKRLSACNYDREHEQRPGPVIGPASGQGAEAGAEAGRQEQDFT